MIVGIGIDIIEKDRIKKVYEKYPENFYRLILHPQEQKLADRYLNNKDRLVEFLAGRFAAKEAYMKATGLGMRIAFSSIAVLRHLSGKPYIKADYHKKNQEALVTITHHRSQALAQVIIQE